MNVVNSKTFRSGNSEAVRLPKEVAFGANIDVVIERNGDVITIRPARDPEEVKRKLVQLYHDMVAIGAPSDGVQERDPFEFPERPGL